MSAAADSPHINECVICKDEKFHLTKTYPIVCKNATHNNECCHYDCISLCIKVNPSCPICRGDIRLKDQINISDIEYTILDNFKKQMDLSVQLCGIVSKSYDIIDYHQSIIQAIRCDPTFSITSLMGAYDARRAASLPKRRRKRRDRRGNRAASKEEDAIKL